MDKILHAINVLIGGLLGILSAWLSTQVPAYTDVFIALTAMMAIFTALSVFELLEAE